MSAATALHDRIHTAQLSLAEKAQDLTVTAVRRVAELRDKAPSAPKPPAVLTRLSGPFAEQLAAHRADWEKQAQSFRERVSAALKGQEAGTDVVRPTVVTSTTTRKKAAKKA